MRSMLRKVVAILGRVLMKGQLSREETIPGSCHDATACSYDRLPLLEHTTGGARSSNKTC